ncbi:iron-sulfur cluster assembly accessory protein [Candidatus Pacearchaeota archaeon]|nr:iron-sulfur cluster assembly accessory protein [Candidatus Pacearchaeota archaeon]
MEQKSISKTGEITKDMIIQDILAEHPDKAMLLSEILMEFGIHCVGCGASGFETLEEGVLGHGFSEEELDILVNNLNKAVKTKPEMKSSFNISEFSIKITPKAVSKVKEIMKQEEKENNILRVSVLAGGCSGYTYDLEIIDKSFRSDLSFKKDGLMISIDKESLEFLNGAEIDFIDTLKESGFRFNNPNATKECGCGKSFS